MNVLDELSEKDRSNANDLIPGFMTHSVYTLPIELASVLLERVRRDEDRIDELERRIAALEGKS